jgi:arylformamidase
MQAPIYREFTSQSQIDAQYNPSVALPDPSAPGQHYAAQAQLARTQLAHTLGIPYGPTRAETLDIFPANTPHAPVLVFIHGGYWRALSSADFSGVALGLQALGITTVVVNYALCPQVSIDEITRQCRSALAWTLRNIQHYGADPQRVAISGHSAGAHLAAMALQTPWVEDYGLPADPFVSAVLLSGLYDLAPLRYSYLQPAIQLDEGCIQRNSPVLRVRPCTTPIWITWGAAETAEFARQSAIFYAAWLAAGNTGTLAALPDADHFSVLHGFEHANSALCQWIKQSFMNKNRHN